MVFGRPDRTRLTAPAAGPTNLCSGEFVDREHDVAVPKPLVVMSTPTSGEIDERGAEYAVKVYCSLKRLSSHRFPRRCCSAPRRRHQCDGFTQLQGGVVDRIGMIDLTAPDPFDLASWRANRLPADPARIIWLMCAVLDLVYGWPCLGALDDCVPQAPRMRN